MNKHSMWTKQTGRGRGVARCCRLLSMILMPLALFGIESPLQAQTDPLNFAGDFRVRHEITTRQEPGDVPNVLSETRNREVVRFRFGISKKINGLFNFGARLATGSPDDPNTTDITMGDFFNDLAISLDRAYMELKYKNLFLTGGKFANPFLTTELVWDGDVNLQGFGASYAFAGAGKITPKLTAVYSIIDEQTIRDDSYMKGGHLEFGISASPDLSLKLGGGYYDYTINSLVNAGAGDILSNRLDPNGQGYLSDFDLVDIVATVEARGFSQRYPIRFVGDYVTNRGADDQNTGFEVDIYVGQASKKNDLRFQYGYAQTETDAVLAAFSHDNTTIATNYDQHTVAADYVVVDNTVLTMTWYLFRRHEIPASAGIENDFFSRVRLNALVKF